MNFLHSTDDAIRLTYHPRSKKLNKSGILTKVNDTVYHQKITIHNSTQRFIEALRLYDQIPIAEDSSINVKLLEPSLPATDSLNPDIPATLQRFSDGISARWASTDLNADERETSVGREGVIEWQVNLKPGAKVSFSERLGSDFHFFRDTDPDFIQLGGFRSRRQDRFGFMIVIKCNASLESFRNIILVYLFVPSNASFSQIFYQFVVTTSSLMVRPSSFSNLRSSIGPAFPGMISLSTFCPSIMAGSISTLS